MPEREILNNAGRLIEKQDEILGLNRTIKNQKEVFFKLNAVVFVIFKIFNLQKQEFSIKMEIFKTRKDELEKKETHFKQSVMKFDKFLKV